MTAGGLTSTGGTITLAGSITGGTVTTTGGSVALNGNLVLNPTTLDTTGSSWSTGVNTLNLTGTNTFAGGVVLNGGILDIDEDVTISGNITHTAASGLDVATDKVLTYSGGALNIGAFTLTIPGSGTINNTNNITLDNAISTLNLTGNDGTIYKVLISGILTTGAIDVDDDFVIMDLDLGSTAARVDVAATKTLIIGDTLYTSANVVLTVLGTGTFTLHDVTLAGDLDINGTVNLAADATLTVNANSTLAAGANLTFMDGLIVADGVTLTLDDPDGTYTIAFSGGMTIGTGFVVVSGDESLDLLYESLDETALGQITDSSSGTVSPAPADPKDVLAFTATPGNAAIGLSWAFQTGTYTNVMIRRDTGSFPADEASGTLVYVGTATSANDGVSNGVVNGTKYYYSAFAYETGPAYAPGVNALAVLTIEPTGLEGYWQFTGSGNVEDSSGKGNHGQVLGDAASTADLNSVANQAFTFDGDHDYIEIDNKLQDDFTIAFWLKTSQIAGSEAGDWFDGMSLIDGKIGIDQNDFGISLGNGKVLFGTGNSGTNLTIKTTSNVADSNWHHVAVSRDKASGDMTIYLDGQQEATGTMATNITLDAANFLSIGSTPLYNMFYTGDIDEIRLYSSVLTSVQIHRLYSHLQNHMLADTGQTTSHTATAGEDNDYTSNAPSFTDNGDGTITDNITNLIWQQVDDGTTPNWTTAGTNCAGLGLAGLSWRLPNIRELSRIANYENSAPAIDVGFIGTDSAGYWTATVNGLNASNAWSVDFSSGTSASTSDQAGGSHFVRCVSGVEITGSTLTNGGGVVVDHQTGLTWQQSDNASTDTWENAIIYCEALALSGGGWRLPDIKELQSIVDYSAGAAPTLDDPTNFSDTDLAGYWSSTTDTTTPANTWTVDFSTGQMGNAVKTGVQNIRCVRGGL